MINGTAVSVALDLLHLPSRVQWQLTAPLPRDILDVLKIAAGDVDALGHAARATGQSAETITCAVEFFLEQIVLSPGADSYRTLASTSGATSAELRRNMALLMRWLHPDQRHDSKYARYAPRVTKAWENLKTVERRDKYDAAHVSPKRAQPGKLGLLSKGALKKRLRNIGQVPMLARDGAHVGRPMPWRRPPATNPIRRAVRIMVSRLRTLF